MHPPLADNSPRQRAPSRRGLATRDRVFDAAEQVFANAGYDGATVRDIARAAGEPVGTIHHHGGGKAQLFAHVVARRAAPLSQARLAALDQARAARHDRVHALIFAFVAPLYDLAVQDQGWAHYARLVAHVSTDARWRDLSAAQFDPTARAFVDEMLISLPQISRAEAAQGLVMTVAALLALITSSARVAALGDGTQPADSLGRLVRFCAAGLVASASGEAGADAP